MSVTAVETPNLADTAAQELAAAVAAALRPDDAPLDYDPCRRCVGAAVERLGSALRQLIAELTPRSPSSPDSAAARATDLAADIRFARPLGL
jgi:hypothetical protein